MGDKDRSRERTKRDKPSRFSEGSRDRSTDRGRDRGGSKASSCRVYVSNIPYEYRWQDLKDLFRNEVGEVQFVELFVDDNDKPRGCGIVEFSEPQSVKKCMETMQRYEVKGRQLVIKEDSGNLRDKYGHVVGSGKKGNRGDRRGGGGEDRFAGVAQQIAGSVSDSKWGFTYGLSPSFLEAHNIDPPLCSRVFVANLDYKVDKKKLKEVFRLAGKVQHVNLHTDKDGNSRGFAVIEFDHPVEAVQAVTMLHNQVLYDRVMTVRLDRANDSPKLPDGLKGIGMGLGTNGEPLKDIAHMVSSLNTNSNQTNGTSNLLSSVAQNPAALQVANALSGLNNTLAANPSVLQAANLSSLLGNGVASGSLSSLMSNNLVPNQTGLAALASVGSNGVGTGNSLPAFGRSDSQTTPFSNQTAFTPRSYDGFDNKGSNFGFGNSGDRDNNSFSNRNQNNTQTGGRFSSKILVTNLPSSASFKMLHEKFSEFGEVKHLEEKGNGGMLVVYSADWQAERAIKNLDRARIDGRTIDARLYY